MQLQNDRRPWNGRALLESTATPFTIADYGPRAAIPLEAYRFAAFLRRIQGADLTPPRNEYCQILDWGRGTPCSLVTAVGLAFNSSVEL